MKKFTKNGLPLLLLFCLSFCSMHLFAGNTKLHIATNKEHYAAAEKIHFQIFLLNPGQKLNNSVFVELLDCNGKKISKQMLPFNLNASSGNIDLPEKVNARFYVLYCYVINNDSVESSISKKIWIQGSRTDDVDKPQDKIRIFHFFEGGTFVAESPNNILIHCTDENLNPVITKGKITDGKNSIYAVFETNSLGFARVLLNPEDKVRYYIEVKDINSKEGLSPVAIAASSGITLNATVTQSSIIYNLVSYTGLNDMIHDYRIEALSKGQIVYDGVISFQNGLCVIKEELKKENFPQGFITFRLIDKSNKIYAQRVIYNSGMSAKNNFISIIDTVNKREAKVILPDMISGKAYIHIKSADPTSAITNDLNFLAVTEQISINDQLIATADDPLGFNTLNNETNRYLSLSGILQNSEKKPLKNKTVNIILLHRNLKKQYLVTKTDREGRLQIDNLIFFDTVTVYYQLADKSEEKNDISLDIKVIPSKEYLRNPVPDLSLLCRADLKNTDSSNIVTKPDEKTLKRVIITADKEKTDSEKFADKYVSGQMKKSHGLRNEIDFIKNPEAIDNRSLWTYLQSSIPGIRVVITPQGNPVIYGTFGCTVGVYLNDMELQGGDINGKKLQDGGSLSFLSNLLIKDVAQVKYYSIGFKPKIIGGSPLTDIKACDGGDLLIYTKRDYIASEEKTKGLPKASVVGYHLDKPDAAPGNILDNGSLFWKADWNVESGQRIYIIQPTSGSTKEYEILIEGINSYLAPYRFTQKLVFN